MQGPHRVVSFQRPVGVCPPLRLHLLPDKARRLQAAYQQQKAAGPHSAVGPEQVQPVLPLEVSYDQRVQGSQFCPGQR